MKPKTAITFSIALFMLSSLAHAEFPSIDWNSLEKSKPWEATETWKELPEVTINANGVPSDAIILFSGKDQEHWQKAQLPIHANMEQTKAKALLYRPDKKTSPAAWRIHQGNLIVNGTGPIETKRSFADIQLHLEWLAPKSDKSGQHYSNSGIFLMGLYEVQILNSFENPTYSNGQAGSIYKQKSPNVNASTPPGTWQRYDIFFTSPKFDKMQNLVSPAFLTVLHNGVLIHNHFELQGPTLYIGETKYIPHANKLPIVLQDHGDAVRFRNIWVREL